MSNAPAEIILVPVADLRSSPFQPRGKEGSRADPALVASVKEHGVIEPLVVRAIICPECKCDPELRRECAVRDRTGTLEPYELLAGHRRLDAARRAKLPAVPCVVREATDAEAAAIVHAENAHRRDLSPLESAAVVTSALAAHGGNVTRAAKALGLSRQAVLRRVRLSRLSPAWRAAGADPASVVAGWGAAHLEAVARLPEESQEALWRRLALDGLPARPTVEDVERLATASLRRLADAPWSLGDADLLPAAGACDACPKRSSPVLFADLGGTERCLDTECWERKMDAHVVIAAKEIIAADSNPHGDLVLLRTRHYPKGAEAPPLAEQAQDAGGFQIVTCEDDPQVEAPMKGYSRALFVDGPRRGEGVMVRQLLRDAPASAASPLPKIGRPTKAEAARRRAQEARCAEILEALGSAAPAQLVLDLVALVSAAFATDDARLWESYEATRQLIATLDASGAPGTWYGQRKALWDVALGRLGPRAAAIRDLDARVAFLERLAAMVGGVA